MKAKFIEHALSILLVTCAFVVLLTVIQNKEASLQAARTKTIEPYLKLDFLDFGDPLHRALFRETLDIFHPDRYSENDSLLQAIQDFRQEQFTNPAYKTGGEERGLSKAKLMKLGAMYVQFILVYLIVIILNYNAAQGLAILRFVQMKRNRTSYIAELFQHVAGSKSRQRNPSFYFKI